MTVKIAPITLQEHGKSCNKHEYKNERQWHRKQSVESSFSVRLFGFSLQAPDQINLLTNPTYGEMMKTVQQNHIKNNNQ